MRLLVARCEVTYSGRLDAFLPEAVRLLLLKSDGSVLVHADSGGYKPLNWMTPPTVIEEVDGLIVVRKRAGRSEDRLEIRLAEVLSDLDVPMDELAGLEKDGVERHLQEALAGAPAWLEPELRLDRREWMTEIGPVDLMRTTARTAGSRSRSSVWDDRGGRAADALPRLHPGRPREGALPRPPCRTVVQAAGGDPRRVARDPLRRGRPRRPARRARARADALRLVPPDGSAAGGLRVRPPELPEVPLSCRGVRALPFAEVVATPRGPLHFSEKLEEFVIGGSVGVPP